MKTLQLSACLIMVMAALSACWSRMFSSATHHKQSQLGVQQARQNDHTVTTLWRSTIRADSLDHQYRVTIFPVDTFHFSPDTGFMGKASRIELTGQRRAFRWLNDSAQLANSSSASLELNALDNVETISNSTAKSMKKTSVWKWVALTVLLLALGLFVVRTGFTVGK